jgi:hypothetical protein
MCVGGAAAVACAVRAFRGQLFDAGVFAPGREREGGRDVLCVWIWFRLGRWTVGTGDAAADVLARWGVWICLCFALLIAVNVGVHVDVLEGNSRS